MRKSYMLLGTIMVLIGFFMFFLFLYSVVSSMLFTAFSLSLTVLGYTSISLAYASPGNSPKTKSILLRTNNTLLISLAAEFVIINSLLAFFEQYNLSIYITVGAIVYFITIWFYIAINPELRNALTAAAIAVFFEFLIIVTFIIIEIIK